MNLRGWAHRWVDALDREALSALHGIYGDDGCRTEAKGVVHLFDTGATRCRCGLVGLTEEQKKQIA